MVIAQVQENDRLIGRRARSRLHVRLPARLVTLSSTRRIILVDLSLNGASLLHAGPLDVGESALVQWAEFEAFGEVVWTDGDRCGLYFPEMVPPDDLIATRNLDDSNHLAPDYELARDVAREWVNGARRL